MYAGYKEAQALSSRRLTTRARRGRPFFADQDATLGFFIARSSTFRESEPQCPVLPLRQQTRSPRCRGNQRLRDPSGLHVDCSAWKDKTGECAESDSDGLFAFRCRKSRTLSPHVWSDIAGAGLRRTVRSYPCFRFCRNCVARGIEAGQRRQDIQNSPK